MKGLIRETVGGFRLAELPVPSVGPDKALMRVEYLGLSGEDGGDVAVGVLEKVPRGSQVWREGQRVLAWACGGHAQYVTVDPDSMVPLPEHLTFEQSLGLDAAANGYQMVLQSALKLGDTAAILGAGSVGLMALQGAKGAGAFHAYVFDSTPQRQKLARSLGADEVFDPEADDLANRLSKIAPSGFPLVLQCSGRSGALQRAVDIVALRGVIVLRAFLPEGDKVSSVDLFTKLPTIRTCVRQNSQTIWKRVFRLMERGILTPRALITKRVSLEEVPQLLARGEMTQHVLVAVDPWG